ncbi:MAG: nucleotidyltransferase domain-containing protein, partial [Ginsengibacter sp.]
MNIEETVRFGLTQKQLQSILQTIQSFPEIEKVLIFGSRASETNRPGSDIDLAVFGK